MARFNRRAGLPSLSRMYYYFVKRDEDGRFVIRSFLLLSSKMQCIALMKMISKSVRLAEDQIEALEREAARSKKSFNGIVREAVDELLALRFDKRMAAIARH
jgi:hypothetical protein